MSNNKMLIDATHPEETRVVVLRGGRVEEFDYESAARKLLRGNIYLAKVTRVEPSLQAAFVDYGGNRHGFLAFNEIHPDYYQIPMADRQALLDEEAAAEAAEEAAVDARAEAMARRQERREQGRRGPGRDRGQGDQQRFVEDNGGPDEEASGSEPSHDDEPAAHDPSTGAHLVSPADPEMDHESHAVAEATGMVDEVVSEPVPPETVGGFEPPHEHDDQPGETALAGASEPGAQAAQDGDGEPAPAASADNGTGGGVQEVNGVTETENVEQVGAEDALEELPSRPRRRPRSYKIQEVIKRRQVILIQVVKEERGNKGAALTTYLSLAGRYTVLMPNTARGGGISRKITNPQDRKRLKAIAAELEVPEGMGLIIRTAGAARTKQEIKRDFEYLLRLWESVRELTLQSVAPSLVYEEGNLIKRSIRDLYNKDVEEIIVAGDVAYHDAKDFMRMLMPSHAKNVIEYREPEPLFTRFQIERQLNAMFSPYVTLRSGGYLVINQTEALVAIDVNSGKSTREFSIEETALNTNLEAADEIARQLKLRDLAGLIVIDFIDMEERRNNRKVEQRLKDALRFDRARIQVGRISHFGLMEMSRQRLRTGVLEGSTSQCPHCQGTGIIRSTESVALAVLRGLEDAVMAGARTPLIATTTSAVALYILNNKRPFIIDMENRLGMPVAVQGSDKMQGANFTIEKGAAPVTAVRRPDRTAVNMDWGFEGEDEAELDAEPEGGEDAGADDEREAGGRDQPEGEANGDGRRRRRRRRRGRRGERTGEGRESFARDGYDENGADTDNEPEDIAPGEGGEVIEIIESEGGVEAIGDDAESFGEAGEGEGGQDQRRERRGRRRGRRGGRRGRDRNGEPIDATGEDRPHDEAGDDMAPGETSGETGGGTPPVDRFETSTPDAPGFEPQPYVEDVRPRRRAAEPRQPAAPATETAAADTGPASPAATPPPAVPAEVPAAVAEEPAPQPISVRARNELTSSEPKIARVVVSPTQTEESADSSETSAKPARKGWWQRNFGG